MLTNKIKNIKISSDEAILFLNENWKTFFMKKRINISHSNYYYKICEGNKSLGVGKICIKGSIAHLDDLFVVESSRRKGIGSTILDYPENVAAENNANSMFPETSEIHKGSKEFYPKKGYETLLTIPNYYYNAE